MKEWYKKEVATVLEETNSGINGLTSEEVKIRQEEQGLNIISIVDRTAVPHGGCRPKKIRRN